MLIWLFKGSCQRKKGQKEKETILDETAAVRRLRDRYWARDLAGSCSSSCFAASPGSNGG